MEEQAEKLGRLIGSVSNYFDHVQVAAIKLEKSLKVGDTIRIIGGETDFEQVIESMQIHHETVEKAKKGDEIGIKVSQRVRKGYKVYKK
jgi:putative protease